MLDVNPNTKGDILVGAPKIMQALFAVATDIFTYGLACKIYGSKYRASCAALALTVFSPWQWFCSIRTLSNSLETTLTVVGLYFWPWDWFLNDVGMTTEQYRGTNAQRNTNKKSAQGSRSSTDTCTPGELYTSLIAAAIACMLRPTNLMVWFTVSIALIWHARNFRKAMGLARSAVICGSAVLSASISVDRIFYGNWVFPQLRFIYFNVVQSLAVFYGTNRPDYYFTEGLPLLLTTALPFAAIGVWQALRLRTAPSEFQEHLEQQTRFTLAVSTATSVLALSLISHKEVRFIYPLLPILHLLAAKPLAAFLDPFPLPAKKYRQGLLIVGLTLNILIGAYTGYVHQRGGVDVMHYIRHEHEERKTFPSFRDPELVEAGVTTVAFFMPCHSTPWRSHFVYSEIDAWALTCEPPLDLTMAERGRYLDEADVFYASPKAWIRKNMRDPQTIAKDTQLNQSDRDIDEGAREWPEYLIFFEQLEPSLAEVLHGSNYGECWRGFNTHWHDDWRRQGDVVVWCMH